MTRPTSRLKLRRRFTKTASRTTARESGSALHAVGAEPRKQLAWLLGFIQRRDLAALRDPDLARVRQGLRAFYSLRGGHGGVDSDLAAGELDQFAILIRHDLEASKSDRPPTIYLHNIALTQQRDSRTGALAREIVHGKFEPVLRWLAYRLMADHDSIIRRCERANCPHPFFVKSKGQKFCSETCSQHVRTTRYRSGQTKAKRTKAGLRKMRQEYHARELERAGQKAAARHYRKKHRLGESNDHG